MADAEVTIPDHESRRPGSSDALPVNRANPTEQVDISVIVCCSNDFDVLHALESAREAYEIIVAMTPNALLEDYLARRGVRFVLAPAGNHAILTNAGLDQVTQSTVIIIDSDTVLVPGTLAAVRTALEDAEIVNVPIEFDPGSNVVTRAVAKVRTFDNSYDGQAYKPGIAWRMSVKQRLGGYWYDSRVRWPCDAEMLWRIREYGITIRHLPEPGLVHRPNPLAHAVRAYFHYGVGDGRRIAALDQDTHWWPIRHLRKRYCAAAQTARTLSRREAAGFLAALLTLDGCSLLGLAWELARPARR